MVPSLRKLIEFIFNFEISRNIAFVIIIVLLGIFVVSTVSQLSVPEQWVDYPTIRQQYQSWTVADIIKGMDTHVNFFLLAASLHIFGNDKVIPFFASMALLILVYLTTAEITKKRFAGIISMVVVLQSNTFLTYSTSSTYNNFWILFYLLSLYLIVKRWPISPLSYILSIFSKAITAAYIPMSLFFIYQANIPRKKKIAVATSYCIIMLILAVGFLSGAKIVHQGIRELSSHDFWGGFSAFSFELIYDPLIVVSLLPLSVGLLIASRNGRLYADSILFFIAILLFLPALLSSLTPYPNEPYRFMPFIVFFSIGVGLLLSKRDQPTGDSIVHQIS
jgi:hypothetical protein